MTFGIVMAIIFFSVYFWGTYKLTKVAIKDDWDSDVIIVPTAIALIGTIPALIAFFVNIVTIVKVLVAPRVMVFEKFIEVIK